MTRSPLDLRLYLVTDTARTERHGLGSTIRSAVDGGVTAVQLRDPDASDEEFVALGLLLRHALRDSGVPLLVNDRVHLVERIGADGAHVGQGDLPPAEARAVLGHEAYLGLSCHTAEQVRAAAALPGGTLDYLGLGPVWATASKPDHAPPIGVDGVRALVEVAAGMPTVAIGGITADRVVEFGTPGPHGVAVVSAICGAEDPRAAAAELRAAGAS